MISYKIRIISIILSLSGITHLLYADQPIRLIIRGDDMGYSHDVNKAFEKAHQKGILTSASLMPPTPFFNEAVAICKANPELASGIHVTLLATDDIRPICDPEDIPSLVKPTGFFYNSLEDLINANPKLEHIEKEVWAQINKAQATGLRFVYLDWHIGPAEGWPPELGALNELFARICEQEKLMHAQDPRGVHTGAVDIGAWLESWYNERRNGRVIWYSAPELSAERREHFIRSLRDLTPGTWWQCVHPGLASKQQAQSTDLLCSEEIKQIIKEKDIQLISYADIRREKFAHENSDADKAFRAGAAEVKITPPIGVPMSGYYYERAASGVHDDLFAHALVFAGDDVEIAIVTCDLIGMDSNMVNEIRQAIERSTGIPGRHVMISCTHAHTGPTIPRGIKRDKPKSQAGKLLAEYLDELPDRIAEAVKQAHDKLQPAQLSAGVGNENSISFNRRFFMTDGTVGWNPGKLNPKIIKPAGPIDPAVAVVYVQSDAGQPISTYVNFANHLDTVGGLEFSADYPYTLYTLLRKVKGPDMVTLFAQGCSGNINHLDVTHTKRQKGHDEAARIGTVLTGEVLKTYTRLRPVEPDSIKVRQRVVQLPLPQVSEEEVIWARKVAATYDTSDAAPFMDLVKAFKVIGVYERQGKSLDAEVQVMALGNNIAWVALPGEIFVEIGLAIKQASPYTITIITELANGSIGYVPDRKAYAEGNYEPVSARCAAGSGELLVQTSLRLLNKLKGL